MKANWMLRVTTNCGEISNSFEEKSETNSETLWLKHSAQGANIKSERAEKTEIFFILSTELLASGKLLLGIETKESILNVMTKDGKQYRCSAVFTFILIMKPFMGEQPEPTHFRDQRTVNESCLYISRD